MCRFICHRKSRKNGNCLTKEAMLRKIVYSLSIAYKLLFFRNSNFNYNFTFLLTFIWVWTTIFDSWIKESTSWSVKGNVVLFDLIGQSVAHSVSFSTTYVLIEPVTKEFVDRLKTTLWMTTIDLVSICVST